MYATYTPNLYQITIIENGGDDVNNVTATYGEAFPSLPPLTRVGYEFTGWTKDDVAFNIPLTYNFVTGITLVANWNQLNYTITIDENGGDTVSDVTNVHYGESYQLPTMQKAGHNFIGWKKDGQTYNPGSTYEFTENITLVAQWEAISYTITYVNDDNDVVCAEQQVLYGATYSLMEIERFGYSFKEYRLNGVKVESTSNLTYTATTGTIYRVVWEDETFIKNAEKKYFKEVNGNDTEYTYVYLTGETYQFEGYNVSGGDSYYQLTAHDTFMPVDPGTFTLTLTPVKLEDSSWVLDDSRVVETRKVKIVYSVDIINMGSDYTSMLTTSSTSGSFQEVNDPSSYVMHAGNERFIPDVSLKNDSNENLSFEQANIEMSLKEGENDLDSSLAARNGNVFNFDESLIGKTLTITLKSKYDVKATPTTLSMKIALNNGVNVYTNEELKTNYSDLAVSEINILRNITAKLSAADYIPGHGESYGNVTLQVDGASDIEMTNINLGAPINDFSHSVYTRTAGQNDSVVINGNYFKIDGSKLPYIDNRYDNYGGGGSEYTTGAGYRIANVQIALFLYRSCDLFPDGDPYRRFATGNAVVNNLCLEGNNTLNPIATQNLNDGNANPLIKISASYMAFVVRGGTLDIDNVTINNTCMGFMLDGAVSGYYKPGVDTGVLGQVQENETHAVVLNANNMILNNSWATGVYMFDLCSVTLTNSKITYCSGPAIQEHDRPYGGAAEDSRGYSNLSSKLILDKYTASNLENWISGDEAWFTAYGFAQMAGTTKTNLESAINPNYLTLYKNGDGKMNFAILCLPTNMTAGSWTPNAAWQADKDKHAQLDVQVIVAKEAEQGNIVFFYGNTEEQADVGGQLQTYATSTGMEQINAFLAAGTAYVAAGTGGLYIWIPCYMVA